MGSGTRRSRGSRNPQPPSVPAPVPASQRKEAVGDASATSAEAPAAKKAARKRNNTTVEASDDDLPLANTTKRSKTTAAKTGSTQTPAPVIPDGRPKRSTRNLDPAGPALENRRRLADAAAQRKAASANAARLAQIEEERIKLLAMVESEEAANESQTFDRFSDLTIDASLDGEFDPHARREVDSSGTSGVEMDVDETSDDIASTNAKPARKAVKGKGSLKQVVKNIRGGNTKQNAGKKDLPVASGLKQNWKSKPAAGRAGRKAQQPSNEVTDNLAGAIGGFDDEDISMNRPAEWGDANSGGKKPQFPTASETLTRDGSRQNEAVTEASDNINNDSHAIVAAPSRKKRNRAPTSRTPPEDVQQSHSAQAEGSKAKKSKRTHLTANKIRIENLPDFAQTERWRNIFIPTLYDLFFCSKDPWGDFSNTKSDGLVKGIQTVVNLVYPGIKYKVTDSCAIFLLGYNRVNERRSAIGKSTLDTVTDHISVNCKTPAETASFISWANRPDGPLFFATPSPKDSPKSRRDPGYIRPKGRLQSEFILPIAKKFLRGKAKSLGDFGYPKGLFALIMAGLERAIKSYGRDTKLGDFSSTNDSAATTGYATSCESIDDATWKEILEACDLLLQQAPDWTEAGDLSLLDQNRATMFDFDSPKKK
ncbi:hypothetical protein C8J56DRAFT_1070288 [Mycena floridula]|nr:hypothetical protein C8J56DRAFT_1070288 [Mycena floridula]